MVVMKKIILIICCLTCTIYAQAGVIPTSYLTIEALIKAHKKQTSLLQERSANEVANTGLQKTVTDITEKYNLIKKKLDGRIKSTYTSIIFAKEAADIALTTKKVIELEAAFIGYATRHARQKPIIMLTAYQVEKQFSGMISEIEDLTLASLAQGTKVAFATSKQRFDFVRRMQEILTEMKWLLSGKYSYIKYVVEGDLKIDAAGELFNSKEARKIANEIISGFKKK